MTAGMPWLAFLLAGLAVILLVAEWLVTRSTLAVAVALVVVAWIVTLTVTSGARIGF